MKPGATMRSLHVVGRRAPPKGPARMNARDHRADDADIGLAQFQGRDIEHAPAGQEQIERLLALGGRDRAQPHRQLDRSQLTSTPP